MYIPIPVKQNLGNGDDDGGGGAKDVMCWIRVLYHTPSTQTGDSIAWAPLSSALSNG